MPSIYEEDRHATATVISDIDASDSKVIVIGVKDEFNATNVVLVDAHQSTQRIAAEIVDFSVDGLIDHIWFDCGETRENTSFDSSVDGIWLAAASHVEIKGGV
uniref:Uncharacterized protein n=1 Tax=Parascaris equorum TaxID=6256 RepID=A0A914RBN8_PAREQ